MCRKGRFSPKLLTSDYKTQPMNWIKIVYFQIPICFFLSKAVLVLSIGFKEILAEQIVWVVPV